MGILGLKAELTLVKNVRRGIVVQRERIPALRKHPVKGWHVLVRFPKWWPGRQWLNVAKFVTEPEAVRYVAKERRSGGVGLKGFRRYRINGPKDN